ncbi:amino acid ABC transporter permease, partial [Fischerella thermalis CCMEE 5328]
TVVCIWLLISVITNIINWIFNQAQWSVIQANLSLFLVGRYPAELYWRLWLVLAIIFSLSLVSWAIFTQRLSSRFNTFLPIAWALSFPVVLWLIGGGVGLQPVDTNLWNGLLLTLVTAVISIVLSFPLGVLLALGRQSKLFVIKNFSILYIEIVRGLPLIGILFLAQ